MRWNGRYLLICILATCLGVQKLLSAENLSPAGPAEDERLLADGLFARGFYQMALREYEKILEAHPQFEGRSALLFRAAESARRQDRISLARSLYEDVIRQEDAEEFSGRSRLRLADIAYDLQEFETARRHAAALLEQSPGPELAAAALHTLASAAQQVGDSAAARSWQRQLVQEFPRDPHAAYAALMLARTAPREEAHERRQWYTAALQNPPSPDLEVEALWGLGMLELDAGDAQQAATYFDRLWRAHPDHPRVQTGSLTIAWAMMMAERFEEAVLFSAEVPERRRVEHPDTWLFLEAVSLRNTEKEEAAYQQFRQLMDQFPGSRFRARAAFELALIYKDRGDHRKVTALADDLLAFPERREDALWILAESHRILGRTEEALQRYKELADRHPATPRGRDAAFQRALLLRRRDAVEGAQALTAFADDHPDDPRAFSSLRAAGTLFAEQGMANAARRAWRQALDQYPANPDRVEVEFALGILELRDGDTITARGLFEALLERDPQGPRSILASYWLAVLAAERQDADAEILLRRALELEQTPENLRNLRLRLARLLEEENALEAAEAEYAELLREPGAPGLSDARLVWMLQRARAQPNHDRMLAIAERMTEELRAASTREAGYYALAEIEYARGNTPAAIRAWRTGLNMGGARRRTAEAAYALARALLETGETEEAEDLFQQAMRWAARMEDSVLQARSMMGMGDLFARREAWEEAARMYMGLAVLFEDPELSPRALQRAAEAFQQAGRPGEARKALDELQTRFPGPPETP